MLTVSARFTGDEETSLCHDCGRDLDRLSAYKILEDGRATGNVLCGRCASYYPTET